MRVNFWKKAWNEGNTGFHQPAAHASLDKYWPRLEPGASVLVPLCGKSLDMIWLEESGHEVIAVEFVQSAVLEFLAENDLAWDETEQYGHQCYRVRDRNMRIFVTDYFHFAEDYDGPPLDSLYDRAALVALPEDMRIKYVAACKKLVPVPRGLVITMEYEQSMMEGPPFSVVAAEVERLWEGRLNLVEQVDMLPMMPRAREAGMSRFDEYFWVF